MKCNSCGAEIPDGAAFCGSCGAQTPPQPQPETQPQAQPQPQASFCANCGAEIDPGATFCANCGTSTGETPNEAPIQYEGPEANAPVFQGVPQDFEKPKKKKKGLKIFLIILAVIVAVCVLACVFKNYIIRAAVGETNFYAYAEYNTLKEFLSDDEFKALLDVDEINIDADGKLKVDGETYSASYKGAYSAKKEQGTASVTIKADGEKVGPVKVNYGEDRISISAKDLMEKAVTLSAESEQADFSSAVQLGKDIIPIIKTCESNLKKNDCMTVSKENVDGKSCRVVTVTLTQKDAMNLAADFLEAFKEDENIEEDIKTFFKDNEDMLDAILESEGTDVDEILESIEEGLDDLDDTIDDLRDHAEDADGKKTVFEYKIAYSGSATVYQREINIEGSKIIITTDISSKEKVLKVEVKGDGNENVSVELKIEKSGKTRNASLVYSNKSSYKEDTYSSSNEQTLKVDAKDLQVDKVGGIAVPIGKIDFNYSYNWSYNDTEFNESSSNKETVSGSIEMTAEDNFKVDVKVKSDGKTLASGSIDAQLSNKADLSDYEEPDEDVDSFEDLMEAFGAGKSKSSYDYDDYDYDYDYDDYDYGDYDYDDYYDYY